KWPPAGMEYEARAARGGPLLKRRGVVLVFSLWAYVIMKLGITVGNFVPKRYLQQVVENSDFRKYDDGLRMILDCTPELADALARNLAEAAASGLVRYGLHRQDAAMMTCFTPSVMRADHVHFIDGARRGVAAAGTLDEMHMVGTHHRRRETGHHRRILSMQPITDQAALGGFGEAFRQRACELLGAIEDHAQAIVIFAEIGILDHLPQIVLRHELADLDAEAHDDIGP